MKSSLKAKLVGLGSSAAILLTALSAKAAEITLSATATDVSDVTSPLMNLVISIWRTVLGPLLGYSIVFVAVVALYHFIKGFLGRRKKPKS